MQYCMMEIKDILLNYRFYKGQTENGIGTLFLKEKIEFIEKSIGLLDEKSHNLLILVYFEKHSITQIAKEMGYSRQGIYKKINRIIKPIAKTYSLKFKSV